MKVATWPQGFSVNSGELPCSPAGISSDPRNVFMRRVKTKPASGYASKQYIASTGNLGYLGDTGGPGDASGGQCDAQLAKSMKTSIDCAKFFNWMVNENRFKDFVSHDVLICAVKDLEGRGPRAQVSLTLGLFWPVAVPMMLLMLRALLKTWGRT